MKQFFVLGIALLALALSGCATRGYARRQAAAVNDRVSQVQTQVTAVSEKHETDVSHANDRITTTDNKLQQAAASAAQANASAAQANASAARADANAARAEANAARAESNADRADTSTAQKLQTALPATGSSLPFMALSGLFSLGAAGALRLVRR